MVVRRIDDREVRILHHDAFGLPTDPQKNVAGIALLEMIRYGELDHGFELEITKHIMPGSGIGSSSASACGAVVAANRLLDERFSQTELIDFAMEGEATASGARHADNVAPCMLGGFTLVRSLNPLDIVSLDFPLIFATVIHPQIEIKTADARAILPTLVPLTDAIRQWSNLGALVAALSKADYGLISRSLEDYIVEPARGSLIPRFDELKAATLAAGALGGGISGSGPSVFMLSETREIASLVGEAMTEIYRPTGIDFRVYVSPIAAKGVSFI